MTVVGNLQLSLFLFCFFGGGREVNGVYDHIHC